MLAAPWADWWPGPVRSVPGVARRCHALPGLHHSQRSLAAGCVILYVVAVPDLCLWLLMLGFIRVVKDPFPLGTEEEERRSVPIFSPGWWWRTGHPTPLQQVRNTEGRVAVRKRGGKRKRGCLVPLLPAAAKESHTASCVGTRGSRALWSAACRTGHLVSARLPRCSALRACG